MINFPHYINSQRLNVVTLMQTYAKHGHSCKITARKVTFRKLKSL